MLLVKPRIGDRFRIPWRDYAEVTVIALPYNGDGIEFTYDETGEKSYLALNSWLNWIGGRENRIQDAVD